MARRWLDQLPISTVDDTERTTLEQDYAFVFESERGKRVLEDLAYRSNTPSIANENINTNLAIWILARQNLITFIDNQIEAAKQQQNKKG
ncbi:hypothetical protein [Reyranella massiliensis]|uniref:hypothetical protein n=1 Tax=Reyranella massiliensis TaxID=445220 RepID=UPI0005C2995B|nr:hypothetical protein [Reyranella massiliensis]